MIYLQEITEKLENILNGLDDETSNFYNPCTSYSFMVRNYGSYLDNVANKLIGRNQIPVYIANMTGNVNPVPNLGEVNINFEIFIYFPLEKKNDFFELANYFVEVFSGQLYTFGKQSGKAVCNLSMPTVDDLQQADIKMFDEFIKTNYGEPTQRTRLWGVMTFTLYTHQLKNMGEKNGFIVGNQVKQTLSFEYEGTRYTEELVKLESSRNMQGDIITEQGINDLQTSGVSKNTTYIDSVVCYARANPFWIRFICLYEAGLLQNIEFDYEKTYYIGTRIRVKKKAYITVVPTEDYLGLAKTFTITFIKPYNSIGEQVEILEMKIANYNAVAKMTGELGIDLNYAIAHYHEVAKLLAPRINEFNLSLYRAKFEYKGVAYYE